MEAHDGDDEGGEGVGDGDGDGEGDGDGLFGAMPGEVAGSGPVARWYWRGW